MPRKDHTIETNICGLPVEVKFVYIPGSPGTRLDPPDPDEIEIHEVLVTERDTQGEIADKHDIQGALSEDALQEIEDTCWARATWDPEPEPQDPWED